MTLIKKCSLNKCRPLSNEFTVLRGHELLNSNPSAKHGVPPKEIFAMEDAETPNTKRTVAVVLHSLKELELDPVARDTAYFLLKEVKEPS